MKFAKYLDKHRILEWSNFERQLEKVERFYLQQSTILERRINALVGRIQAGPQTCPIPSTYSLESIRDSFAIQTLNDGPEVTGLADSALLDAIKDCQLRLRRLQDFASINVDGFRKILKKFDKKCGTELLPVYLPQEVFPKSFASWQIKSKACATKLEEAMKLVLNRIANESEILPSDEIASQKIACRAFSDIWKEIYEIELKSIVETDSGSDLKTALLHIDDILAQRSFYNHDNKEPKTESFNAAIAPLLEREKRMFQYNLLRKICINHAIMCFEVVVQSGFNINALEASGDRPLAHDVIASSGLALLQKEQDQKKTLLLQKLINAGLSMESSDAQGRRPLHYAVIHNSFGSVCLLMEEARVSLAVWDHDGNSPLFYAIRNNFCEIVDRILQENPRPSYSLFAHHGLNPEDEIISTPLHLACLFGATDVTKLLLNLGADITVADSNGETALHISAKRGDLESVDILLKHGADLSVKEKINGWNPLFFASIEGHSEVAEKLSLADPKIVNDVDFLGWTAQEHAVFRGHLELASHIRPDSTISLEPAKSQPGSPALLSVAPREYGHSFLDKKTILKLSLGNRFSSEVALTVNDSALSSAFNDRALLLSISYSRPGFGAPIMIDLPLQEECFSGDLVSFTIGRDNQIMAEKSDAIIFDILSAHDPNEIVACGIFPLEIVLAPLLLSGRNMFPENSAFATPILCKGTLEKAAVVRFELFLVTPFFHKNLFANLPRPYWKAISTKLIGHRGLGANFGMAPQIGENTLLSFITAASLGAEYVEFGTSFAWPCIEKVDVQLTRDLVPVIYHDWAVSETGLEIPVSMLTLDKFLQLRKTHQWKGQRSFDDNETRPHLRLSTLETVPRFEALGHSFHESDSTAMRIIKSPFATLAETFGKVPAHIGFNIEIKYPNLDECKAHHIYHMADLNTYCDRILSCVYEYAGDRAVIFSSFHPEICMLISLKQPHYPVFFLTEGGILTTNDPRCNSLQEAIRFAQSYNLLGIVCDSTPIVAAPKLIRIVKENGLLLFTYGMLNNELANVQIQKAYGVDAVIVDSVARIRKGLAASE